MTSHNNNSAQVQTFKDYQAIPEQAEEVLENFSQWLEDEKSQALIKAGEQELLVKWSK